MIYEKIRKQIEENGYKLSYKYRKRIIDLNKEVQRVEKEKKKYDLPVLNRYEYCNQIAAMEDIAPEFTGSVADAIYKVGDITYSSRRRLKELEISAALMLKKKKDELQEEQQELYKKVNKVQDLYRFFMRKDGEMTHVKDAKNLDLLLALTTHKNQINSQVVLDELNRRGIPPIEEL